MCLQRHVNSVAQKDEVSEMSAGQHSCHTARTGPRVHDWPRSLGERRKKNGKPDLSLLKKAQEREQMPKLGTTCTSRQVRWITMTTDTYLSIF